MDYQNERYVRLYTRDTTTWKLLSWEARTTFLHLLRKVDRAGVLDVGEEGTDGLAAMLELPVSVVASGIVQLTDPRRSVVVDNGRSYVIPNFMAAQEARASDKQRQRDSRETRRLEALVTRCHTPSHDVTPDVTACDSFADTVTKTVEVSQGVTECHKLSHGVTPSLAKLSQTKSEPPKPPIQGGLTGFGNSHVVKSKTRKSALPVQAEHADAVARILGKLSERTGVNYRGSREHERLITGRLADGVDEMDLRAVIAYCWDVLGWNTKLTEDGGTMAQYMRPETLFGPRTIHRYLPSARKYREELTQKATGSSRLPQDAANGQGSHRTAGSLVKSRGGQAMTSGEVYAKVIESALIANSESETE